MEWKKESEHDKSPDISKTAPSSGEKGRREELWVKTFLAVIAHGSETQASHSASSAVEEYDIFFGTDDE